MNRVIMFAIAAITIAALSYTISTTTYIAEKSKSSSQKDYVEYIDLGCDSSELKEIRQNNSIYKICKGISEICQTACKNISAPEVQARIGKENTVKCRCYRKQS